MSFFRPSAMRLLLACGLLLAFSAAHAAYPLTVRHVQGNLTLTEAPKRVAVFDLATLDTLDALGVEVAGVPQLSGPAYLKKKYDGQEYARVGTLFEPDYAVLEVLKPDLIIIAGRSRGTYEKLSAIAPTLDLSIAADSFVEGIRGNLRLLGKVFEREQQAERLDGELQQALAAVQDKSRGLSSLTLFTVNDNLALHAPGERFGMLSEVLGTRSVVEPVEALARQARPEPDSPEARALRERQQARLQAALAQQPDWLIVLDRGAATGGEGKAAQTLGNHAGVAAATAWRQGKVFYLDPATWYIATGGYQGLLKTLKDFSAAL